MNQQQTHKGSSFIMLDGWECALSLMRVVAAYPLKTPLQQDFFFCGQWSTQSNHNIVATWPNLDIWAKLVYLKSLKNLMVLVGSLVLLSMFYDVEGVFGEMKGRCLTLLKVFDIQLESCLPCGWLVGRSQTIRIIKIGRLTPLKHALNMTKWFLVPKTWVYERILRIYLLVHRGYGQYLQNLVNITPSIPKWLYVFLNLAKLRSVDHWPNNCKYDSSNREHQLLQNAPKICGAERLLYIESMATKIFDVEPQISSWVRLTRQSFWDRGSTTF